MSGFLQRNSKRRQYQVVSTVLLVLHVSAILVTAVGEIPSVAAAVAIALSVSCYISLAILTFLRLRDAALSGWWSLPIILIIHVGPRWQIGSWSWGSISFTLSALICFVPVVIGWLAVSTRSGGAATNS